MFWSKYPTTLIEQFLIVKHVLLNLTSVATPKISKMCYLTAVFFHYGYGPYRTAMSLWYRNSGLMWFWDKRNSWEIASKRIVLFWTEKFLSKKLFGQNICDQCMIFSNLWTFDKSLLWYSSETSKCFYKL